MGQLSDIRDGPSIRSESNTTNRTKLIKATARVNTDCLKNPKFEDMIAKK